MTEERINLLASKWQNGTLSPAEKEEFEQWYASFDERNTDLSEEEAEKIRGERIFSNIQRRKDRPQPARKHRKAWALAAAISGLLTLLSGAWYLSRPLFQPPQVRVEGMVPVNTPVLPGGNKATLTLDNGHSIQLDSGNRGHLPDARGISMPENGLLAYAGKDQEARYNTLSTPRGGQFRLLLPDGTRVWLNAASAITYPTVFTGTERKVSLKGEAYFEVAPDKSRPFMVSTGTGSGREQIVEVLGTHFNINAYDDEPAVKTTLVEGSVRVMLPEQKQGERGGRSLQLNPGQQAVLQQRELRIRPVNTAEIIAWKNGLFQFNDASLQSVLRQLARWYDVKIDYKGTATERRFSGKIYRDITLAEALEILRFTKVNFQIVAPSSGGEKRIIVSP